MRPRQLQGRVRSTSSGRPIFLTAAPAAAAAAVALVVAAGVAALGGDGHATAAVQPQAGPAGRLRAIGALFTTAAGGKRLGAHFCTASVVDSPGGDLVMTAAHCLSGLTPRQFVFVPVYQHGKAPYGVWSVTRVIVDQAWSSSGNPDDDVAFLVVSRPGVRASVQAVSGGNQLGIGQPAGQLVKAIGYPDGADAPISCLSWANQFSATQLEFDCNGYADGTSGSPLLADVNPVTGLGTVIGVIGGFQQGGETASVSYAVRFGTNITALYHLATAEP
jgi:V8-like Glu-specific endopeptidase